ncbi:glycosyltransferase family A protein [Vreelandella neptunia]|uniref:glycosyltransferase family 2 protein n=1 Tax=Vreelandella neptunia TaxID=115551 RepID=UPI00315AB382
MKYSILIPTYNRKNDLEKCISSVRSAVEFFPAGVMFEILVSDNNSKDGTLELLEREFKLCQKIGVNFKYWSNESNVGARANVKKLISKSLGEFLFFITDDDILFPSIFEKLDAFVNNGDFGFVKIPNITYLVKSKRSNYYGDKKELSDAEDHVNFIDIMKYTHVLSGCVLKRNADNLKIIEESENVYPSILMCAINAGKCGALSEPLILHQWENEIFWEKDVDMTSHKSRNLHTFKDQQLAMLHIDDNFFSESGIKKLYNFFIKRHGFVVRPLIEKFGIPDGYEVK